MTPWWNLTLLLSLCLLTSACAVNRAVSFKINTEPEGATVIYRLNSTKPGKCNTNDWVYLGSTPLEVVRHISTDALTEKNTVSLKVLRPGYTDQVKEWDAETFWEVLSKEKRIFWAPQMVPQQGR